MKTTDQIAAEAKSEFLRLWMGQTVDMPVAISVEAIIQAAIEKATEQIRADRDELSMKIGFTHPRAAHASEEEVDACFQNVMVAMTEESVEAQRDQVKAAIRFALQSRASQPTYCQCDEINGDNPACPIHKTWTIETVGMIIGNVPVGDAAEAIAKAHNATHANEK